MAQARVMGTAGHVDHGKSTLVQALTGIQPDRLPEEQTRQLTIDLGFAWLKLEDGSTIGIVDVPGHRDFIENMLAGVGGIDAALLVIAADEGVMPQTREHLSILHLLGIPHLIVALTKCDLVDDEEWLTLVELDIADLLESTTFAQAEIILVSAHTGAGMSELRASLARLMSDLPPVLDRDQPRLPIDRVFTLDGFGTIVTGTLRNGSLRVGEEIQIAPQQIRARVRALQCYEQAVEEAPPGARVAVNLSGLRGEKLRRGQLLSKRGDVPATQLVDAHYEHLSANTLVLKHNMAVKVFAGAAECTARLRLLGTEQLAPGEDGWLQLRLDRALALAEGDRYILRIPSPARTIGGGVIVDPLPQRRWKRFSGERIQLLQTRRFGNPTQKIIQLANTPTPMRTSNLAAASGLSSAEFATALEQTLAERRITSIGADYVQETNAHHQLQNRIIAFLKEFHQSQPLSTGLPAEELRHRLQCTGAAMHAILATMASRVSRVADRVKLNEHELRFTPEQLKRIDQLDEAFQHQPSLPPTPKEAAERVGTEVWYALLERGDYVQVAADVVFAQRDYAEFCSAVLQIIDREGSLSVRQLRDQLQTSRKYAIALLEHLDEKGITKRVGDERIRGPLAPG